jgi:1,4-alpha-glucan branching enzyme
MKGFLTLSCIRIFRLSVTQNDEFLEESWLYEAITETYIPLIDMLEGMVRDHVPCRLTMSLTPPLLNMLSDSL